MGYKRTFTTIRAHILRFKCILIEDGRQLLTSVTSCWRCQKFLWNERKAKKNNRLKEMRQSFRRYVLFAIVPIRLAVFILANNQVYMNKLCLSFMQVFCIGFVLPVQLIVPLKWIELIVNGTQVFTLNVYRCFREACYGDLHATVDMGWGGGVGRGHGNHVSSKLLFTQCLPFFIG